MRWNRSSRYCNPSATADIPSDAPALFTGELTFSPASRQGYQLDVQGQTQLGGNISTSLSTMFRSEDYLTVDDALSGFAYRQDPATLTIRNATSAAITWAHPRWGMFSYVASHNQFHHCSGSDIAHTFSTSQRVGNATLNLSLQSSAFGQSAHASLSLPLGQGTLNSRVQKVDNNLSLGSTYQGRWDENRGYSVGVSGAEKQQRISGSANLRTPYAQLATGVSQSSNQSRSVSLSASGAMAYANGSIATSSQSIGDTFAIVDIPEQGNLRVQAPSSSATLTHCTKSLMRSAAKPIPSLYFSLSGITLITSSVLHSMRFTMFITNRKHRHHPLFLSALLWFGLAVSLLLVSPAKASFKLESTGIILNENDGRVSFNIQNTSPAPLLLVTKLIDLDGSNLSKQILISPPITRIDAGQSQQVNFVLKKGTPLSHEVLLKASFEGVSQAADNSAKMPIRQDIGFIVQPSSVPQTKTPWEDLKLSVEGQQLVVANPGKHVIRLAPQITLLPANKIVPLENYYLLAGETKRLTVSGTPTSVVITPLSRYGFKLPEVTLPVSK